MSETLTIQSHKGPYTVHFEDDALAGLDRAVPENAHFIIDDRVAELYGAQMAAVLGSRSVLRLEACEEAKSLDRFPAYVEHLVARQVRRGDILIAIGGGIIQDITCFLAATLLRGIAWQFYPTTLLAQADSCIGSKSSINAGAAKNILGTFTPPGEVHLSTRFLETLDEQDVRSGVGEILKVHAIDGAESFDRLAAEYDELFASRETMGRYLRAALEIKKSYIEKDEFDRGERNIFNYGHSFGHAIEAATGFAVPHGIGVTIGMDMANYTADRLTEAREGFFARMHPTLRANYRGFETQDVPLEPFLSALAKDKKNVGADLTLIQPGADNALHKRIQKLDGAFRDCCRDYLAGIRTT